MANSGKVPTHFGQNLAKINKTLQKRSATFQEKSFHPFYRIDRSRARRVPGPAGRAARFPLRQAWTPPGGYELTPRERVSGVVRIRRVQQPRPTGRPTGRDERQTPAHSTRRLAVSQSAPGARAISGGRPWIMIHMACAAQ